MRIGLLATAVVALSCLFVGRGFGAVEGSRPNIVYILADDMGWADVSFNGGEISTPNIDRIAKAGAKLAQFYVQPVCSPTRASLMTGRYPMRMGLQVGVIRPWADYGMPLAERTLPSAIDGKEAWATIAEGKASPHEFILHNVTPTTGAIRVGDWKLVINGQRRDIEGVAEDGVIEAKPARPAGRRAAAAAAGADRVELFNMAQDPYEKKNLAAEEPEKAKELRAKYDELAGQAVKPKGGPQPKGYKAPKVWGEAD